MRNFFKIGDIIVIAVIAVVSLFLVFYPVLGEVEYAVIYVNGEEYGRFDLNSVEPKTIEISSDYGFNIVKIEKGQACVTESNCRDKLDVKAGAIGRAGQSLVCLPNRLVITIEGGVNTDATAF